MDRNDLLMWWIMRPAKWWEFYFPQSGCIGGFIFGSIICSCLLILLKILVGV